MYLYVSVRPSYYFFFYYYLNRDREERPRRDFGNNDAGDVRTRGRGGIGRPRGGRGTGRIYDQRGKREFDRQSGSDKT